MNEELQRDLGRVEGKLDSVLTMLATLKNDFDTDRQSTQEDIKALQGRVGKVENRLWFFSGAAALLGYVLARVDLLALIGGLPRT